MMLKENPRPRKCVATPPVVCCVLVATGIFACAVWSARSQQRRAPLTSPAAAGAAASPPSNTGTPATERGVVLDASTTLRAFNPCARHTQPLVVTACNDGYARAAVNLALSARHFGAPETWVYDLGIERAGRALLGGCGFITVRVDPSGRHWYPDWSRNVKEFAWKAIVIKDAIDAADRPVLYMDAGSEVRRPLDFVFEIICRDGHAFFKGQDNSARRWVHDAAARCLGVDDKDELLRGRTSYHAGTVGVRDVSAPAYRDVIAPWYNVSFYKDCVAPAGSTLTNHRQDQAAMTVLAYQKGYVRHWTRLMADAHSTHRLTKDPLTPSNATVVVARGRNSLYLPRLYKPLCESPSRSKASAAALWRGVTR